MECTKRTNEVIAASGLEKSTVNYSEDRDNRAFGQASGASIDNTAQRGLPSPIRVFAPMDSPFEGSFRKTELNEQAENPEEGASFDRTKEFFVKAAPPTSVPIPWTPSSQSLVGGKKASGTVTPSQVLQRLGLFIGTIHSLI